MSNEKLLREALIRLLGYATSLESTTDTDGDHPAMKQARYALSLPAEVGGALENKGSSMITTIDLTESGVKKFFYDERLRNIDSIVSRERAETIVADVA